MFRIGVVNIDTSHPKAYSGYLAQGDRARYAAVYNDGFRGDDEVEAFIARHGMMPRFHSIAEMADAVDVGFIHGTDWDKHLEQAMPFIERGKPVFIDKPFAGKMRDCRRLEELAASGAAILGSSSLRYADEITAFVAEPEEERGRMLNVFGSAGVNEFDYGIHTVEAIGGLYGPGAVSNEFIGAAEGDGCRVETFFTRWADGRTAVYSLCHGPWQPFELHVTTTKKTHHIQVDAGRLYAALLDRICDALEAGAKCIVPVTDITESVKILLAGRISREQGGGEVRLADIPDDDPGYDGASFARYYASKSAKMYLG